MMFKQLEQTSPNEDTRKVTVVNKDGKDEVKTVDSVIENSSYCIVWSRKRRRDQMIEVKDYSYAVFENRITRLLPTFSSKLSLIWIKMNRNSLPACLLSYQPPE